MYGLDRWSEDMLPHIKLEMWAKSSQWLVLSRRLGRVVDADSLVLELFAKHCLPGRRCVGDVSLCPSVCDSWTLTNNLRIALALTPMRWLSPSIGGFHRVKTCLMLSLAWQRPAKASYASLIGGSCTSKISTLSTCLPAGALHSHIASIQWRWKSDVVFCKSHLEPVGWR